MEARLTQIEGQYCWRRFSIVSHVRLRRTRPIYFIVDGRTVRAYEAVLTRMDMLCVLPDHGLLSATRSRGTTMNDVYYLRSSGRRIAKTNVWFSVARTATSQK